MLYINRFTRKTSFPPKKLPQSHLPLIFIGASTAANLFTSKVVKFCIWPTGRPPIINFNFRSGKARGNQEGRKPRILQIPTLTWKRKLITYICLATIHRRKKKSQSRVVTWVFTILGRGLVRTEPEQNFEKNLLRLLLHPT